MKANNLKAKKESGLSQANKSVVSFFDIFGIDIRQRLRRRTAGTNMEELLAPLDMRFRSALLSMYRAEPQVGDDGQLHIIDNRTSISVSAGRWIYDLCLLVKPNSTLEIGMGYGFSSIYILAALAKNLMGRHTAIDPFQHSHWHGIGSTHANTLAPVSKSHPDFLLIEDRSDHAATDLSRSNAVFDLIFIDGNHRFDDVLVDFYLYSPLCSIGGHIILDDMWMDSIQAAISFIRRNRKDVAEIESGDPNICAFKKVAEDTRSWNDFHDFGR